MGPGQVSHRPIIHLVRPVTLDRYPEQVAKLVAELVANHGVGVRVGHNHLLLYAEDNARPHRVSRWLPADETQRLLAAWIQRQGFAVTP